MDELWSPWGVSPLHHHTPWTNQPRHLKGCKANLCFTPILDVPLHCHPKKKQVVPPVSGHLSLTLTLLQLFYVSLPRKQVQKTPTKAPAYTSWSSKMWHSQSSNTGAWALLSTEITTAKEAALTFCHTILPALLNFNLQAFPIPVHSAEAA